MSFRSKNSARQLLPFGLDYSDIANADHGTDKPELILPVNGPLTDAETDASRQAISIQQLLADGPFYTGSIHNAMESTSASSKNKKRSSPLNTGPDGIERYSDKYKKVKKIGRTIEEHSYSLELFPDELYSVMGISNKKKQKLLALSTFKSNGGLREYGSSADLTEEDQAKSMLEKLKDMAEELDNGDEKEEEAEDLEEDVDDEFDEDDDDDYNAEKYFDDGDEDGGDTRGDDEAAF